MTLIGSLHTAKRHLATPPKVARQKRAAAGEGRLGNCIASWR